MSNHQKKPGKHKKIYQTVVSRKNSQPTTNYQLPTTKKFLSYYCQQIFKSNNQNQPTKLLWLALFLGTFGSWSSPALAEGSRELTANGGDRPFLEYRNDQTAGIPRRGTIFVYANDNETINLGSSALGLGNGDIRYTAPNGTTGTCRVNKTGGLIADRNQEIAGPLPNAGGYTPCVINVGTDGPSGIWQIEFISPNSASITDPYTNARISVNDPWTQNNNVSWIAAWDVTVRNANGQNINGRTYAKYLPFNMGGNDRALNSQTFIQTQDGYQYRVRLNGLDPYGFIFFANNKGFTNGPGGPALYQSVQLPITPPVSFLNPNNPDTTTDYTHKIFFNQPDINLPSSALTPSGPTWLLNTPTIPPRPSNFQFRGIENTPNQTGTAPLNGRFTFDSPIVAPYTLVIDINRDGIFGNANDKIFNSTANAGQNTVNWDVTDGNGVAVPPGDLTYRAQVTLYTGEVHFPLFDAENNPNGIIIQRVDPVSGVVISSEIYYNDSNLTVRSTDRPSNPRTGFRIPSSGGAHSFGTIGPVASNVGFGNERGIDTWVYVPSDPLELDGQIAVRQADLEITKTHEPANPSPGGQLTYILRVRNLGPSSLNPNGDSPNIDALVQDTIPAQISNLSVTCEAAGGAICRSQNLTGNELTARVNLPVNATATYRITGTLAANVAPGTTILNDRAIILRSNDVTDPNDVNREGINNNLAQDQFVVGQQTTAEIRIDKTGPATATAGQNIVYNLAVIAEGTTPSTNVQVNDQIPAGLTLLSISDPACNNSFPCTLGDIPNGQTRNLTVTLAIPENYNGPNQINNNATVTSNNDTDPSNNTDTVPTTITIPQRADVVAVKTGPSTVDPGGTITYNITVTNNGPSAATNVIIRDTLPAGVTFNSASDGGTFNNGAVNFPPIPSLAAGASINRTITVTAPTTGGPLLNIVASTSDTPDPTPTNNDGSQPPARVITTITPPGADLITTKTGPATVAPGGTITYTITTRNDGPNPATNVIIRDNIPAGTTFSSASDGGTFASGVVSFPPIPSIAPGTSVTRTVTIVAPNSGGPLVNQASNTSDTPDPNPNNNNGSEPPARVTTTITQTPVSADVVTTKTGPSTVAPSGTITYTITTTNNGPNPATNVVIRDNIPPETTFGSASDGGTFADGVVTFPVIPIIDSGTSVTRTITVTAPASGGPLVNRASNTSDTPDPNPNNNNGTEPPARVTTTITEPPSNADVVTIKSGPSTIAPNGTIIYSITTTNNGPSPATNIVIRDALPPEVTFNSASNGGTFANGVVTFPPIPSLAVGESVTRTITATAPAGGGPLVNQASNTSDTPDPTPENNDGSQPPARVITTITNTADVVTTKTGPSTVAPNGIITYTITTSNNGPVAATNVVIRDAIPPETTFNSASDGGTFADGVVTFPAIPSLAPNTSVTRTVIVTAPAGGGPLVNRASNTSDTPDSNPSNNDGSQPPARVTTTITATTDNADLVTTKTGPSAVTPGGRITYTITTTNNGPAPASNVIIRDTLPAGATFNGASDGGTIADGVVTFPPIPTIAPGTSITRTVNITAPTSGGPLVNRASNTSDTPDPNPNNNNGTEPPAQVVTTITNDPTQIADVVTTKTGPETAAPGGTITYTITTRNNGPAVATNVIIRDNIPPETTFASASDGGTFANGAVTFPAIPTLAPGTAVSRTVTVTAPNNAGSVINRASNTSDTPDPTPSNNDGSQPPARVVTTITSPGTADVVTSKTGPATVNPGGTITYTITVVNNGPNPASNIIVRDTLPQGLTFNNASDGGTFANGVVSFPAIPSLAPGASVTRTITATAPNSGGPFVNQVSSTSDTPDPNPSNNNGSQPPLHQVTTTLAPIIADVQVTQTGPSAPVTVGSNITFTAQVTNISSITANQVVFTNPLPPGVTFVSVTPSLGTCTFANNTITCNLGDLAPGQNVSIAIVVTATTPGTIVNPVSINLANDSNPNNNNATAPAEVIVPQTDLEVKVTGPTEPQPVGNNVTFNIGVTNTGTAPGNSVVLTNPLPENTTFVSAIPTQGTCELSGNNVVCNLGNINPAQTVTVPLVITPSVPGTINNSVTITSPSDTQATNNQAVATTQIVPREPRLRLVKRITSVVRSGSIALFSDFVDDPADQNDNAPGWSQLRPVGLVSVPTAEPLRSGDTVEYTIYFLSDGTAPADNVNLCDAIPTNTTFLADGFGTGTGMQLNLAGAISALTNVQDGDAGRLLSPLAPLPSGNPCADQTNSNGSLLFNFNQISNSAGSNFGFVRFRVRID
ncbi:hypothetical protein NIES2119_31610 [[Phormidium ambiguum] IAM M-71]|uniref:DUF11 domain-containing protein n=1 Tax=[Phormidium ambiguum] IAM M-71 TaxID=454136 RepID=A0A1U7I1W4_9CYAN|nr:DUF11 domain-containing protein [Phormidium ambiguum]OKH30046.1 hypothetical protein NIES2119_31610 [Phormidium ambiguum IAM M-71]